MKHNEKLKLVEKMVACHCRKNHRQKALCLSCSELIQYIADRLKTCHLPEEQSSCFMCTDYCYNEEMRGRIRTVMRSSATCMLVKSPVLMFKHLIHLKKLHRHL